MPIKQGSTNFGSLYLGSTKIGSAYLGNVRVFGPAIETATIGGKQYRVVKIGSQIWMAENLDYMYSGLHNDAYQYKDAKSAHYWAKDGVVDRSRGLYYNYEAAYYLYTMTNTWSTELSGFRVPGVVDYNTLINRVGTSSTAGLHLKSTTGWNSGFEGDNSSKFNAKPYGYIASSVDGSLFPINNNYANDGVYAMFCTWVEAGSGTENFNVMTLDGIHDAGKNGAGCGALARRFEFNMRLVKDV